jgi:flagellar basal body rod protein FlgG
MRDEEWLANAFALWKIGPSERSRFPFVRQNLGPGASGVGGSAGRSAGGRSTLGGAQGFAESEARFSAAFFVGKPGIFLPASPESFAGRRGLISVIHCKTMAFALWHRRCFSGFRMNVSLYQAAAALNANSRWQDVISENLASSSVPGFRKKELSLAAVQAGLLPTSSLNSKSPQYFSIPKATTSTSFQPGDIQYTGDKSNVAIEGKGFFQVQLPNGKTGLTRDGEFQVNAQGQLVTKEGYPVMGDGGAVQLDPHNPGSLSISANGDISQGAEIKGKLKVIDYEKPELLTQISGAYFVANNTALQTQSTNATLRQGYLEGANTSVVREMANMMTAMRGFEANQHIIQIQDDRLGKTIADLGNPN